MIGWKILTHDYRSPIQGGEPIFKGEFPFQFPKVELDTSDANCGAGWNYCRELHTALRIGGLWPDGFPSMGMLVESSDDCLVRGDKYRASELTAIRAATASEIELAVNELSAPFGKHRGFMVAEQLSWRHALARPVQNKSAVIGELEKSLEIKGLEWGVKEFQSARAAFDARATWDDRDARAAFDAWAAWDAFDARAAWAARAARAAFDAFDAWAALTALTLAYASKMEWIKESCDFQTIGVRDAYQNGAAVIFPTGPSELGFVMV